MGYINATYQHPDHDITIEVLEPTKDENHYKQGMRVQIDNVDMKDYTPSEFRDIITWLNERLDFIENNFDKKGKPIKK